MKILFLTPIFPYPLNNGGVIRVHHLLVNLAARHQVTMLSAEPKNDLEREGIEVIEKHGINVETVAATKSQKVENKRLYQLLSLASSKPCLLYTSPSPRDRQKSRMPSSA